MKNPRNLFILLALTGGLAAILYSTLTQPSASIPERPYLIMSFTGIAIVMGSIGIVYWIMEKLKRPIPGKIGLSHYLLSLLAVVCGIICTTTAHDGIVNSSWTKIPSFLSIKLFIFSLAVFLFGIARALMMRKSLREVK